MNTDLPRDLDPDAALRLAATVGYLAPESANLYWSAVGGETADVSAELIRDAARARKLLLDGNVASRFRRAVRDSIDPKLPVLRQIEKLCHPLLAALDIHAPNDDPRVGWKLIEHLLGDASLNEFDRLDGWAAGFVAGWRATPEEERTADQRAVAWLAPELVTEGADGRLAFYISFRLFVRVRLVGYCLRSGLNPRSGGLLRNARNVDLELLSTFIDSCAGLPTTSPVLQMFPRGVLARVQEFHQKDWAHAA